MRLALALALLASPALAGTPEDTIAQARADCAEMGGGVLTVAEMAVESLDLGDGVTGKFLDESRLECSTSATLGAGGTGGPVLHIWVDSVEWSGNVRAWQVIDWQLFPDEPPLRVVMMERHGTFCGRTGNSSCVESLVWDGYEKQFNTVAPESASSD